ncbi:MAG TPA: nucleoside deaminase, partial [Fimbriiglobus sp.]|nr:nucleoside deaminase [Fimbriiglobus sp.]
MTPTITVANPDWLAELAPPDLVIADPADRVRLAIRLALENVERGTGGPFGAAVFEAATGRLVAAGVNRVVPLGNSALHAEVVALMFAEARVGSYSLSVSEHELVASCEPCAMCLGATLWSGVRRLAFAAARDEALAAGFDEGPVFPESYAYLARAGVEVVRGLCREEGAKPFELIDGDLALHGRRIDQTPPGVVDACRNIAVERGRAINWLCGEWDR